MADDEQVEEKSLTVEKDALYMLRWRVPAAPQITIRFVNPPAEGEEVDQQDFHFPDPPGSEEPTVVEITMKKGKTEAEAEPERFRNKRQRPTMATQLVKKPGKKPKDPPVQTEVKVFSAAFRAREEGMYIFTTKGGPKTLVQKMTVTPATPVYNTIEEVMNDPNALRRQAVLAAVADFYPAFNTCTRGDEEPPAFATTHKKSEASTHQAPNAAVGKPSGYMGQGNWVSSYGFCSKTPGTSCTATNPMVMNVAACAHRGDKKKCLTHTKDHGYWAFDATKNPGWVVASRTKMPSVGDTYVLNNGWDMYSGHVGIVLHVPPDGNGLWVTADGGAGTKPSQLGLMNPRWGLMGAMLPLGGKGKYPKMVPKDDDGPFLAGATGLDIDGKQPVPARDGDVDGIIQRIFFRQTEKADAVSNPRRIAGYVNVDNEMLKFKVDGQGKNDEHLAKCKDLQTRVEALVAATLAGGIMGGAGT